MTKALLKIRDMCDLYSVTPRTLRFYENKGLLSPLREGQKRFFTPRDQTRLKLILQGKRFGFSLAEIQELLDLYHCGDQQTSQLMRASEIGEIRLEQMKRQQVELSSAINELTRQLRWGKRVLESQNHANAAE